MKNVQNGVQCILTYLIVFQKIIWSFNGYEKGMGNLNTLRFEEAKNYQKQFYGGYVTNYNDHFPFIKP